MKKENLAFKEIQGKIYFLKFILSFKLDSFNPGKSINSKIFEYFSNSLLIKGIFVSIIIKKSSFFNNSGFVSIIYLFFCFTISSIFPFNSSPFSKLNLGIES